MGIDAYTIIEYCGRFIALMFVFPVHEFFHAFAAVKSGDDTPIRSGRYTLNPFAHINLIGLLMFLFVGFGWAQPVPVNPYNFKHMRRDYFWVSIAGVLSNIAMAFIAYPLFQLASMWLYDVDLLLFDELILVALYDLFALNLCCVVFNLIPVFPLDGFRVLESMVKKPNKVMTFLREKGYYVLLGLLFLSFAADRFPQLYFLDILGYFMSFAVGILGYPITLFWGLFF